MGYNTVTVIILFCSNYFDVIHQRQIKLMRRQLNLFTLQKDKRYLILECVPEERNRLLDNYIEELFRSGPPPPPTASAPSNRSKMHWSTESYFASVYFLIQTQSHCFAHCIVQGNRKLQSNILNIEASLSDRHRVKLQLLSVLSYEWNIVCIDTHSMSKIRLRMKWLTF